MINELERKQIEELLRRKLSKLEIYESADRVSVNSEGDKILVQYKKGNYFGLLGTTHLALEIRDKNGYLLSIGRNAKYKGRGVGRELYHIIENFCRDIGIERIPLCFSGEGREEYWKSLGFARIGEYDQMEKVLLPDKNI